MIKKLTTLEQFEFTRYYSHNDALVMNRLSSTSCTCKLPAGALASVYHKRVNNWHMLALSINRRRSV